MRGAIEGAAAEVRDAIEGAAAEVRGATEGTGAEVHVATEEKCVLVRRHYMGEAAYFS